MSLTNVHFNAYLWIFFSLLKRLTLIALQILGY